MYLAYLRDDFRAFFTDQNLSLFVFEKNLHQNWYTGLGLVLSVYDIWRCYKLEAICILRFHLISGVMRLRVGKFQATIECKDLFRHLSNFYFWLVYDNTVKALNGDWRMEMLVLVWISWPINISSPVFCFIFPPKCIGFETRLCCICLHFIQNEGGWGKCSIIIC